jgi:serine/threonine protein kinase
MLELMRTPHFPQIHTLQKLPENSYIIMEKLDFNLEDLFLRCKRQFSLQTVALIIDQTIETLRVMHDHGYLHRDLKP